MLGLGLGIGRRRSGRSLLALLQSGNSALIDFSANPAFQDINGQTVAGIGDTFALALDTASGAGYSSGTFTGLGDEVFAAFTVLGTGWTDDGGGSYSCDGTQVGPTDMQQVGGAAGADGTLYAVTFTISNYVAGEVRPVVGGGGAGAWKSGNGTHTQIVRLNAGPDIFLQGNSTFDGTISDISYRLIPGSHAFQPTAADEPTLTADGAQFNGISKHFDMDLTSFSLTTTMTVFVVIGQVTGTSGALIGAGTASTNYLGYFEDTSAGAISNGAGTPDLRVNGSVVSSPTRDDLHTQLTAAGTKVISFRGVDMDTVADWANIKVGCLGNESAFWAATVPRVVLTDITDTAMLDQIEAKLTTEAGV